MRTVSNRNVGRSGRRGLVRGVSAALGLVAAGVALLMWPSDARADDAEVTVGRTNDLGGRFAEPPPGGGGGGPVVVDDEGSRYRYDPDDRYAPTREPYRSPVRLELGPMGATTGRGLGLGLGVAAAFGSGTVGARLQAAWMRGEVQDDTAAETAQLGSGVAQYTGELTLDLHKRGPLHPVFGMGFGLAHVSHPSGGGNAAIGTGRFGLEYALTLDDADVRLGGGVTGVLAGPSDHEVDNLRGYALVGAQVAIGF